MGLDAGSVAQKELGTSNKTSQEPGVNGIN